MSPAKRSMLSWMPGLVSLLHYQRRWLASDMAAGLSVAAIALPVGIAYASLAGVPPVVGIYSAIFPLLAYALFGSSKQLMTGPDAATCIMVAASLTPLAGGDPQHYMAMLVMLTLMTGVLYVFAGMGRLGFIANFLSQPVLTGYLNGIALIIIVGQLPKLFGYVSHANEVFPKLQEFILSLGQFHLPTTLLGLGLLVLLILIRRFMPAIPSALVVVVVGILLIIGLKLEQSGIALLGHVPAGLPTLHFAVFDPETYRKLFHSAAGLGLISFTSGVLTAKSFARRNHYNLDPNQELIAFGACNIVAGLAQGFPVTGADSRTAVNNAMGGKTQLVGVVAAISMLVILFFLTGPLAYVPIAGLAAVIIIAAIGLFDIAALRDLQKISTRELMFSLTTTAGVLILGVLPGVLLAITLSLIWLLSVGAHPRDEVLGHQKGVKGFHNILDYPEATTVPGMLLYRFDADLLFYNIDYFIERINQAITAASEPIKWVVIDASPINVMDVTALQKVMELREELASKGIFLAHAHAKSNLVRFFNSHYFKQRPENPKQFGFPTLKSAIAAFHQQTDPPTAMEPDGTEPKPAKD
ncbi:MAG: SulP family inorganic anion transporter [Desulfobulbaceae bacterium]|nr:SulP family inorganic anion transporter [Desulfobulbaceae bacterium]